MTLSHQGRQTLIKIDRQLGYIAGLFAVVGSVAACVLMGITVTACLLYTSDAADE